MQREICKNNVTHISLYNFTLGVSLVALKANLLWLKSNRETHACIHPHTHTQSSSHSCTSHTCAPPHSVINRQTVPIWGLDTSQLCSSSVVKLLTPTGRETKRGADQAAQQRGDLEKRKEEVNRDKLNIRGAEELCCLG